MREWRPKPAPPLPGRHGQPNLSHSELYLRNNEYFRRDLPGVDFSAVAPLWLPPGEDRLFLPFYLLLLPPLMIASLKARAAAPTSAAAVTALITAGCRAPRANTWAMFP